MVSLNPNSEGARLLYCYAIIDHADLRSDCDISAFLDHALADHVLLSEIKASPPLQRAVTKILQALPFLRKVRKIMPEDSKFISYLNCLDLGSEDASHDQINHKIDTFISVALSEVEAVRLRILIAEEKVSYEIGLTEEEFSDILALLDDVAIYLQLLEIIGQKSTHNWSQETLMNKLEVLLVENSMLEELFQLQDLLFDIFQKPHTAIADQELIFWENIRLLIQDDDVYRKFKEEVGDLKDKEDVMDKIESMFGNMALSQDLKKAYEDLA